MIVSCFPRWLSGKELPEDAEDTGDLGLIPQLGRSPGRGKGNAFQYTCLKKIPRTGEPGRLWSMGSKRTGHNWAHIHAHAFTHVAIVAKDVPCLLEITIYELFWFVEEYGELSFNTIEKIASMFGVLKCIYRYVSFPLLSKFIISKLTSPWEVLYSI